MPLTHIHTGVILEEYKKVQGAEILKSNTKLPINIHTKLESKTFAEPLYASQSLSA